MVNIGINEWKIIFLLKINFHSPCYNQHKWTWKKYWKIFLPLLPFLPLFQTFEKLAATFTTLILVVVKVVKGAKITPYQHFPSKPSFLLFSKKSCKNIFQKKSEMVCINYLIRRVSQSVKLLSFRYCKYMFLMRNYINGFSQLYHI